VKKLLLPGLILTAIYFAVFGGEYSLFELRSTRAALQEERTRVAELRQEIDSLRAWADSLEADSVTLERLARERYGMVRSGEILYRFAGPDSLTARDTSVIR